MKPLKIIHLSGCNPEKPAHHPPLGDDYYFVASWAGLIARRLKKYVPGLDLESWRVERDFLELCEKNVFGIKGVIWPHKRPLIRNLLTSAMVRKLNEIKNNHFVILHYHDLFNFRFVLLVSILCPGIKIVLSHHGGNPPRKKSLKRLILKAVLKKSRIAQITYLTPRAKDFIEKIAKHPPHRFIPVGADYSLHKPGNMQAVRSELNLEQNKIYAIYVGKYYRMKSVDLILAAYNQLKGAYNFAVIFVGGSNDTENDLYNEVIRSGCPHFGLQYGQDMPKFYQAADFYIHPTFNPDFGGLDVSWIEALACNKPVVSTQLAYLDFEYSDLGVLLTDKSEIIAKTEWMINNHKRFARCREASQAYLDGNTAIMEKMTRIYEEIYH